MEALVLREDRDGLARLTLNRPDKLNALSMELFVELDDHVAAIEADPTARAVLLKGAGKCFSAGHDLGASPRARAISSLTSRPR